MFFNTLYTVPSPPRDLTITRVFQHGIELNWIPPRETNGDIQHYIIKCTTQDGTEQEITTTDNTNYYNLTGLERGQTYNIRVVAVNSAGTGGGRGAIYSKLHTQHNREHRYMYCMHTNLRGWEFFEAMRENFKPVKFWAKCLCNDQIGCQQTKIVRSGKRGSFYQLKTKKRQD